MAGHGLNQERIVDAAMVVADRGGLVAASMRNVGRELGVEAMSLYHHIPSKDALLDALAERIYASIEVPAVGEPWREAMSARARSAREVLTRHPWALGLVDSRRAPGPAMLRYYDSVVGCLLSNGFSPALATHVFSAIDSYVFGFVLTEQNLPFGAGDGPAEMVGEMALPEDAFPHLARLVRELIGDGFSYADEFPYGLELILDQAAVRLAGG